MDDTRQSARETHDRHLTLLGGDRPIRGEDLLTDDHPMLRWRKESWWRAAPIRALAFAGIMVLVGVAMNVGGGALLSIPEDGEASDLLAMAGELIGAIVAYAVVVWAMERRRSPIELAPMRLPDLLRGFIAAFACVVVNIGIIALFGGYRIVGFDADYVPWADLFMLGLTAGVAEEIIMRGILLRLVEEGLGSWGAVVISALIFGILHVTNPDGTLWGGIAIAIEAGLLFGAIYLATRSLWWCIGFHAMWNVAEGPIFGSIVSGTGTQRSWLVAQWSGPDLLTGGRFGLEASIVPVVIMGALAIALLIHLQCHGRMIEPVWIHRKRCAAES
ncbi:CPBP family intramembrane glutamic endopeptidase [Bifidobacterium simiarum]|uniref:CPBP family intramembrane glutamic endopeptidase n=1 Tax=Bifidobacterium simiarum TaxID=2045441 RepID=UPI001BDC7F51|nr:CPBP family intramembrane glutamic endopeptidase [Bifidobacterium simiarum]MBT1165241.1 CPBP family intramembrane metalloprotease [Bifidobacterium simiarum]